MELIGQDFPSAAETVNFDPLTMPPDAQRRDLWKLLMGRQHGNQEQSDGKVVIPEDRKAIYTAHLDRIRYGRHSFMGAVPLDTEVAYDAAGLGSGTPLEDINRLRAVFGTEVRGENVANTITLTGQRLRGIWPVPGEGSVDELLNVAGQGTGTDIDELTGRSPWIQAELRRTGEDWTAPFPTEWEICRFVGEAVLYQQIDWKNYDDVVETTPPIGPNEAVTYEDKGVAVTMPPREHGMVTYHLKNGQRWHVVNGAAVPRAHGMPRATCTSIAEEAALYLPPLRGASMVAVSGAPHLRGAVDTAIAYMDKLGADHFARFDVAGGPWVHEVTDLVAALGEIMATMKADLRLRAVLSGQNPNTPALAAI